MKLLVLVAAISCIMFVNPESPKFGALTDTGHTADSLDVVKQSIKAKKAVLIDVREQSEWDAGHLRVAALVPLSCVRSEKLTPEMKKSLPKDKPIYCHCRSGRRVLEACQLLRSQGYDIRPLKLGYEKLVEEGFEKASDTQE